MSKRSYQERDKRVSEITRIINLAWQKVSGGSSTVRIADVVNWVETRYDCSDWEAFWRFCTDCSLIELWKRCPPYQMIKLSNKPNPHCVDCTDTSDLPTIYKR